MTAALLPCDFPATTLPPTVLRVRHTFIDVGTPRTSPPSPQCHTTPACFAFGQGRASWGPFTPTSSRGEEVRCVLTKALSAPVQVNVSADPFLQQKPAKKDALKYLSNQSLASVPEDAELCEFDAPTLPPLPRATAKVHWDEMTPLYGATPTQFDSVKLAGGLALGALIGTPQQKTAPSPGYATMSEESALEALRAMLREREAGREAPRPLNLSQCVAPPDAPSFASTASTDGEYPPPVPMFSRDLPPPPLQLDENLTGFERMTRYGVYGNYGMGNGTAPCGNTWAYATRSNNAQYARHQLSSCPIGEREIREQTMREDLVRAYRSALAEGDSVGAGRFLEAALKLGVANSID